MEIEIKSEAKPRGNNLEKKHQQIAEAAASLFIEKGFHKTTIRDIAKTMGMSIGNLYYYINTKDDVLLLVYRQLYKLWDKIRLEKEKPQDPAEKLRSMMIISLRFAYKNTKLFQMTFLESKNLEKTRLKKIMSAESNMIMAFVKTIEDGIDKGVFRNVNSAIIANFIFYCVFFYPLRRWFFKGEVPFADIEKEVVDFILESIVKKE